MLKFILLILSAGLLCSAPACAQNADAAKPTPVIGTITSVDPAAHTVTVKEDKTGTEYVVQVGSTKTLLKVEPTAKDLKNAVRITADDLAVGDRIQVAALKSEADPKTVAARSVILMSARDLQKVHADEAAAWQHSTPGVVNSVDPTTHTVTVNARTPDGLKPITVNASSAQFTRYSPENPKVAAPSQIADVEPGNQIRIIGQLNPDGTTMTASKIYTSSFRTTVGTVSSTSPDGKQITIKDLQTKQPVTISLNDDSSVHKLPQMMAYMLARRFNPDFKMPAGAGPGGPGGGAGSGASGEGQNRRGGQSQGGGNGQPQGAGGQGPGGGMRGGANGDLSQMIDRLPKISAGDLKNGDAVIVSGMPVNGDKTHLLATNVIAGVEPIFQSASPRQAQALNDWGAAFGGGGGEAGMPGGGGTPQ
ncbi:MAG TPA: hypothetical protein VH302_16575 [Bryobacteraceae bacterium]|jgi:hypothetical protein|nr:hypothetical protein [Bryobacteraceae bacterium]